MQIISVINYKGGVGKTTLTANLAAELARCGKRVLLLDMDPQCSLTFSFVSPDYWADAIGGDADANDDKTIKRWFDGIVDGALSVPSLHDLLVPELAVNGHFSDGEGTIDLIASHIGLINVDLELATMLGGANLNQTKRKYVQVHGRLRAELAKFAKAGGYDLVLIDCPPNFNIVTKNAIVASDGILIPAKPDRLSTLGISYLVKNLGTLVTDYNEFSDDEIHPEILGVVFTMVQIYGGRPIAMQRRYMLSPDSTEPVPVFREWFRENKTVFSKAPQDGIPVVLQRPGGKTYRAVVAELKALAAELCQRIGL